MTLKHSLMAMVSLFLCLILAACGSSNGSDTTDITADSSSQYSTRIHMLMAESGSLTRVPASNETGSWTLTLNNIEPAALWYTDRPGRESGSTPVKEYASSTWDSAYGNINPNATLQFRPTGAVDLEGVYITLSNPLYDEKLNTLTFHAKLLNDTLDQPVPDSVAFTSVTLNVLNNAADDQEVSSYIQYASQAVLLPAATPNQYQVVLSNAGPDMFWVDNAPGTYSDSRPMSYFFPQWANVFGDNPPNAALFGTTVTGELKLYFLTLTEPKYDAASDQVSYTGTLLRPEHGAMEALDQVVLSIDSGQFSRFPLPGKGVAYQAFGEGYNPSSANSSWIYFGSDIARKQTGALWGPSSNLLTSCNLGTSFGSSCRNDLQTMKNMGINLIRLYDWDTRNDHSQFLNHAHSLGLKVVVPISNWLPQNPAKWTAQVPDYFNELNYGFKGQGGKIDWHPAIAGVIISNELDHGAGSQYDNLAMYENAIGLVAAFLKKADELGFSKSVPVGVPVTFVPKGAPNGPKNQTTGAVTSMPSWDQFERLLSDSRTAPYKDRLMLCPNTYNSQDYLFNNAENTGKGWVQLTYERFNRPILFTEIGLSRAESYYTPQFVRDQLQGVISYQQANPAHVLGALHFQFSNKVWKQTPGDTDTEGAFGSFRHAAVLQSILTVKEDYTYWPGEPSGDNHGTLTINALEPTSTYDAVVEAYK
ncbi:hypothetical protein LKR43_14180 [Pusillimonas sp. MFBS29]|uniref:hypothetical protein n=1 Tax=Pusillimonas sp. MFBS29 TaxID=2886690 RepID=UPI001D1025BC|nr:hypothetical protein [Pusillimonas sp. MFBS29]MCC2597483.1 hypothetical protein [Pusillimonas sp. MFBS29]